MFEWSCVNLSLSLSLSWFTTCWWNNRRRSKEWDDKIGAPTVDILPNTVNDLFQLTVTDYSNTFTRHQLPTNEPREWEKVPRQRIYPLFAHSDGFVMSLTALVVLALVYTSTAQSMHLVVCYAWFRLRQWADCLRSNKETEVHIFYRRVV